MSVDAEESMFGERATLARGLLFTALALGTLGVGIVDGGSHWFFSAAVIAAIGGVNLYSESERERKLLSLVAIAAVLIAALVLNRGLLP